MGQLIDCPHGGTHRHGTTTAYKKDRCRCPACSKANTRASTISRMKRLQGTQKVKVPAAPAKAHIATLLDAGATIQGIATEARLSAYAIRRVLTGQPTLWDSNEAAILALHPRDVPSFKAHQTSVHGSRLRIQALHAIGYTMVELAPMTGQDATSLKRLANPDAWRAYQDIDTKLARRIRRLYDNLWDKPPTPTTRTGRANAARAITQAAAKGWVPPLGLDEDRIDDPTYQPNPNHNVHRKAS